MKFIKEKVLSSPMTRGLFAASGSPGVAEVAGRSGFDWILLDMEHGLGDENATLQQITALDSTPAAPIVRIPALRPETIKRLLDFGASGIMAPMVENADEARLLVSSMRYPPLGIRGLSSGSRAAGFGFTFEEYFKRCDSELLCIAQIESAEGVKNIDSIAAVDGIDVLFIGHSDLALNLGCHGNFDSPEMISAEERVLAAAKKYGNCPGMLLKSSMKPETYRQKGFRFLALGTDMGALKSAFSGMLKQ